MLDVHTDGFTNESERMEAESTPAKFEEPNRFWSCWSVGLVFELEFTWGPEKKEPCPPRSMAQVWK